MKTDSPRNGPHLELFIATLQSQILTRAKLLADGRILAAKRREEEAKALALTSLKAPIPTLPRELIVDIVSFIPDYGKYIRDSPLQSRHSYGYAALLIGWTAHRVIRSLPMTAHINTEISETALHKILACKSIDLTLDGTSALWNRSITLLLQHPHKWKGLSLQIYGRELSSILQTFAIVLPKLDDLQIILRDGSSHVQNLDVGPVATSIGRSGIKIKTAAVTWVLLEPFSPLGLLRSVTSLRVDLVSGAEDQMLRSIQFLSGLPCLEELDICTMYRKLLENNKADIVPVRCQHLRSIKFRDVHSSFLSALLKIFNVCDVYRLYIEASAGNARWMMTNDTVKSLHDAFPKLTELHFTIVSDVN